MLVSLRNKHTLHSKNHENKEEYFNAEQNAITAKDAEKYYRTMIRGRCKFLEFKRHSYDGYT